MEDVLQILFIVGILIFGFIKQARKSAQKDREQPIEGEDIPLPHEDNPLPEASTFPPMPPQPETIQPPRPTTVPFPKRTVPDSARTALKPTAPPADDSTEMDIHSLEDVRRGIIWSEILQRKY